MTARASIDAIYRQHGHVVLRRARQILGAEEAAREVLQEIFASLVARPQQFGGRSAITTWLYSATTHRCLNRLRDQRNRDRLLAERVIPFARASAEPSAERAVAARELLAALPDDLATVAIYYYFDGMTHAEIAEVMRCSRRQIGKLLERVREHAHARENVA